MKCMKSLLFFILLKGLTKLRGTELKKDKPEEINKFITSFSQIVRGKNIDQLWVYWVFNFQSNFSIQNKEKFSHLIVVKLKSKRINLISSKGFELTLKKINEDSVELFEASKSYIPSRNLFIYNQLKKGAILSKRKSYKRLKSYFQNSPK